MTDIEYKDVHFWGGIVASILTFITMATIYQYKIGEHLFANMFNLIW